MEYIKITQLKDSVLVILQKPLSQFLYINFLFDMEHIKTIATVVMVDDVIMTQTLTSWKNADNRKTAVCENTLENPLSIKG